MASVRRDHNLNLGYLPQLSANQPRSGSSTANTSPVEAPAGSSVRMPFGNTNGMGSNGNMSSNARIGAGSPSHEMGGSRLFSKRAREIQAQEGVNPGFWGPPTSGGSTPLRETIPESPTGDAFPDFIQTSTDSLAANSARRARAGTLPSRFSPSGMLNGLGSSTALPSKSSRPTPSTSPFKPGAVTPNKDNASTVVAASNAALLSRLRSGSTPQRSSYIGPSGPFGPSVFTLNWQSGRERAGTLSSVLSNNSNGGPASPAHSSFSKEGLNDSDVKTLDYLGLIDTPPQNKVTSPGINIDGMLQAPKSAYQPFMVDLANLNKNNSRFRSYSVNAKERYAEEEDEALGHGVGYGGSHSGSITPSAATTAAALAATQAQIHQHNLAVQAFVNQASANRPRARTAGVLDSPPQRSVRNYLATPSRLDNSITAADLGLDDEQYYDTLTNAVHALQLDQPTEGFADENTIEGPTRALWLGGIPSSTTVSSLTAIFKLYGTIESTRVLTQKNCGFVNYDHVESAIQAKSLLNGKEIFPGAGPIRIGYAKVPSTSGTPGQNGITSTPSPDPLSMSHNNIGAESAMENGEGPHGMNGIQSNGASTPAVPELKDMKDDTLDIVEQFGAADDDKMRISAMIDAAITASSPDNEIPPIPEPSHNRVHDAPRLREIRKRIDNNSCSQAEIEEIAMGMLPEIAELSSDYLGNTVVQKLFEYCTDSVKESMLREIAPHLAEIGVHKNGTWAAQKIIDVAKTPAQMSMIVEALQPYTVALFADQYGNYVLQCCLRFGFPWNNFIFVTMISQLWEIAQGRFGARAMRACLESHHASKDQQRLLAAAITQHSVQLATNANGALLLTWFLDTCTFPRRRTVLAPRLVSQLVRLCTHKVAYLTVLKVINQRNEPEAGDTVLQALFFSPNDTVLQDILRDHTCGATLIFKVLTTPFFDENIRGDVVQNVRNVLIQLKAQPNQGYKRLMDEVGLSTRSASGHGARESVSAQGFDRQRPNGQAAVNGQMGTQGMERQYTNGQFYPGLQQYDPAGSLRAAGLDPTALPGFDQFGLNGIANPLFAQGAQNSLAALTPQQLQYQHALLAASARSLGQNPFFPGSMAPPAGLGGYGTPSPSLENSYRGLQNFQSNGSPLTAPSPMLSNPGFAQAPGFNPMGGGGMIGVGGFGYPMPFVPPQQGQQSPSGGGRRGRR